MQDAGQVIPGGVAIVVKPSGPPRLCRADEIGEICIHAHSTGCAYWGLDGLSTFTFKVYFFLIFVLISNCVLLYGTIIG